MEQLVLTLLAMIGAYLKGRYDGDKAARRALQSYIDKGKKR